MVQEVLWSPLMNVKETVRGSESIDGQSPHRMNCRYINFTFDLRGSGIHSVNQSGFAPREPDYCNHATSLCCD